MNKMRALRQLRCRLPSTRLLALLLIVLACVIYCFYYNVSPISYPKPSKNAVSDNTGLGEVAYQRKSPNREQELEQCPLVREMEADIDTQVLYPSFEFQPSWLRSKEFWDKKFEDRYELLRMDRQRLKLKVIVVPHSHNDPGWLKTFEQYFETKTNHIINNIVHKLNQHLNMTFIWSEISFLHAWWERAHPVKRKSFKKLVIDGRLEITAGGWVMPDEACTHIYALVDQFIEGHNWVMTNLGVAPKTGWSIDPFGHGPTVPHLLEQSGLEGTIIQRIHYAWKQWLAQRQIEEFYWVTGWEHEEPSMIVHNMPFDIYSIKSTCGPHPAVCVGFDFRKIPGEYTEYTAKYEEITERNLPGKARALVEQYRRIGSLTPHNVVLVPLGDDFRYEHGVEFDAQYANYMKMFAYINSHSDLHAEVSFGTPADYFTAVRERHNDVPTLKGDFFVYSDIFSEGKPAYWSGYYTTRPYLKILARQFEHQLRSAEILFTLAWNSLAQGGHDGETCRRRLDKSYEQLVAARRSLGLFQHHDAITGTSKANVMSDYGTKIITSVYHCVRLQETALGALMLPEHAHAPQGVLQSETEWEAYGEPPRRLRVSLVDRKRVVVFNSLAEERVEVVTLRSNTTDVRVFDTRRREYVPSQVAPIVDVREDGRRVLSDLEFEVAFVATLPPLAAVTFALEEHVDTSRLCAVYCDGCDARSDGKPHRYPVQKMKPGDVQIENSALKLLVDRNSGLLRQVQRKDSRHRNVVEVQFGAYRSAQRHSGAYLFMPDYDDPEREDVLAEYTSGRADERIIILAGPVFTEISTAYLPFLVHTVRLYSVPGTPLERGVQIENLVDFESPPKNRETELFMRVQTDLQNGEVPEFYTDQNGFHYQKRVKVGKLGVEANYYPLTTMAWLQDERTRLTYVTDHAQGAAAYEPGRLEVMLDRRTLYDDHRGVGEGVVDNKPTLLRNWLLLEPLAPAPEPAYELPSRTAERLSRALNYPAGVFLVDSGEGEVAVRSHGAFSRGFPPALHVLNLRTVSEDAPEQAPSREAYLVLHRPGTSCSVGDASGASSRFTADSAFGNLRLANVTAVSLTGLRRRKSLAGLRDIELKPMELKTYRIRF
ncbi:alpha-mannosidase 2 isoform X2 [Bicyclus anynana]|uniref:Alpha-mannosidase n=1 Tax=Bicyclus anynana TaxID=110368 RepID=A0A6J1MSI0_BICAN|nr:alpha-mannosidase 2 isoform X2 [Bicyclus anynana]